MIAGERAPDFTLLDHTGRARTLSSLLCHGPVVLFFFPIASSPICTAQACHFRDLSNEFAAVGARRVGISTDTVDRQAHFAQQRSFDYLLLSDADGVVSELFGVRRGRLAKLSRLAVASEAARRGLHSRRRGLLARLLPVKRTTFVIDVDRVVLKVISSEVRAALHADQALWFLENHTLPHIGRGRQDHLPNARSEASGWFTESSAVDAPSAALAVEATVEALDNSANPSYWPKNDIRGQIVTYCVRKPSVAEIAAQLSLPLGATRYLIDDLVAHGYLQVRAPRDDVEPVDRRRELIVRTLAGLRAL